MNHQPLKCWVVWTEQNQGEPPYINKIVFIIPVKTPLIYTWKLKQDKETNLEFKLNGIFAGGMPLTKIGQV